MASMDSKFIQIGVIPSEGPTEQFRQIFALDDNGHVWRYHELAGVDRPHWIPLETERRTD